MKTILLCVVLLISSPIQIEEEYPKGFDWRTEGAMNAGLARKRLTKKSEIQLLKERVIELESIVKKQKATIEKYETKFANAIRSLKK